MPVQPSLQVTRATPLRPASAAAAPAPAPQKRRMDWSNPKVRWSVLAVTGLLLVGGVGASLVFGVPPEDLIYVELYMTDAPASFDKIELCISGAFIGEEAHELPIVENCFDILQYHDKESIRFAKGEIKAGAHEKVCTTFSSARYFSADLWTPFKFPKRMLCVKSGFNLGEVRDAALLLDLKLADSIRLGENGFEFWPYVENLFVHDLDAPTVEDLYDDAPPIDGPNGFDDGTFSDPDQDLDTPGDGFDPPCAACEPDGGDGGTGLEPGGSGEDEEEDPESPFDQFQDDGDITCAYALTHPQFATCNMYAALQRAIGDSEYLYFAIGELAAKAGTGIGLGDIDPITGHIIQRAQDESGGTGNLPTTPEEIIRELDYAPVNVGGAAGRLIGGATGLLPVNLPKTPLDPLTGAVTSAKEQDEIKGLAAKYGCEVVANFRMSANVLFACNPAKMFWMCQEDLLSRCEVSVPVELASFETATQATRWSQLNPDILNPMVTGAGTAVAIIDTGFGTHADLPYDALGNAAAGIAGSQRSPVAVIYGNAMILPNAVRAIGLDSQTLGPVTTPHVAPPGRVEMPDTEDRALGASHGTSVAGVIAARPSALANVGVQQSGLAPGAKIFGYAFGRGLDLSTATFACEEVLYDVEHPRAGDPPILALQASWGIDPEIPLPADSFLARCIDRLAARGVTAVFGAGNAGANVPTGVVPTVDAALKEALGNDPPMFDGSYRKTFKTCSMANVICVGAFDDRGSSDRAAGKPWARSSGGQRAHTGHSSHNLPGQGVHQADYSSYPHILAPAKIRTTHDSGGYVEASGTSFSAPQVTACVLLMQGERIERGLAILNPLKVREILLGTAYKLRLESTLWEVPGTIEYAQTPLGPLNWKAGAGLMDCEQAVQAAIAA